jgi:hypothetical protein
MFAGDSSFGLESIEMMEIMMVSTCSSSAQLYITYDSNSTESSALKCNCVVKYSSTECTEGCHWLSTMQHSRMVSTGCTYMCLGKPRQDI